MDRRSGASATTEGEEFVLIIETSDSAGNFDNIFDIYRLCRRGVGSGR